MYMKQIEGHIQRIKDMHKHGNLSVVIPVQESGVGERASVGVNAIAKGIEWNKDKVFISPERPLQYANRHELYQEDLDKLDIYKQSNRLLKAYTDSHSRLAKKAEELLNKTTVSNLTQQQLKDLIKLLEFEQQ